MKRKEKIEEVSKKEKRLLIPSGSTLLNLACSDTPFGAFALGKIVTMPGSSSSGKTMSAYTVFAEMAKIREFDEYEFYHDDVEEAVEFDVSKLFANIVERVKAPRYDDNNSPIFSDTIQDLEANILLIAKKGKPFIYVVDSLDSLTSGEELEMEYRNALKSVKSDDAAKQIKESYGTERAKITGKILRMVKKILKDMDSTLIIIQQEREKIGVTFGSKDTTSGGKAPFYYSTHQVWLKKVGDIKEKDRIIGTEVEARVKKNRLTGKLRTIEYSIYNELGIDDVGSCIDFLVKEGHWKKNGRKIKAEELDLELMRKELVDAIEEKGLERKLQVITGRVWAQIEESIKLNRKPKY